MTIAYPKPHPPSPAPAGTAIHKLIHTANSALVQEAELHFHKGLKHDSDQSGRVDANSFKTLLTALNDHTPQAFQNIALGLGRKLINPQAGLAADREAVSGWLHKFAAAPEQSGHKKTTAAEMIELYWMALLRDVSFEDYSTSPLAADAAAELSALPLSVDPSSPSTNPSYVIRPVTPNGLFRGGDWTPSGNANLEHAGPYISQFLWLDVPFGSLQTDQKEARRDDHDYGIGGIPHLTVWADWLEAQSGKNYSQNIIEVSAIDRRYIQNGGDLARYVHIDALYEAYLNAALILLAAPNIKFDTGNPYTGTTFPKESPFGTFGGPYVLSIVCEVATRALKAVWYQKFIGQLRLRPEAYAGLVHRALHPSGLRATEAKAALGDGLAVLESSKNSGGAVARISTKNAALGADPKFDTYLLPMCFQEGSPTHPAYGAGHATVAGACVTVLKAIFQGTQTLKDAGITPMKPDALGKKLVPLAAPESDTLTIGGELDKVASNIAIGRNLAGVHWRTDYTQSVLLGQRVATSVLYHHRRDYHERPWSLSYRSFGGKVVTIGQESVTYGGQTILDGDDDLDPAREAAQLAKIV